MRVEFKENWLCVRWEFLYEVLALQSTQSLALTFSSKEAHDYPVFLWVIILRPPFSTPWVVPCLGTSPAALEAPDFPVEPTEEMSLSYLFFLVFNPGILNDHGCLLLSWYPAGEVLSWLWEGVSAGQSPETCQLSAPVSSETLTNLGRVLNALIGHCSSYDDTGTAEVNEISAEGPQKCSLWFWEIHLCLWAPNPRSPLFTCA